MGILESVRHGIQADPIRMFLHGPPKAGKSTFASKFPKAVVIDVEGGMDLLDCSRLPKIDSWAQLGEQVMALMNEPHDFKTLVVDTVSEAEKFLWQQICAEASVNSIEDAYGGYGKGYVKAVERWWRFCATLNRLRTLRKMHIVLLCHSLAKGFSNPEGTDYHRWAPSMHDKSVEMILRWADIMGFIHVESEVRKDGLRGKETIRDRVMVLDRSAGIEAGNRYKGLPMEMRVDFDAFWKILGPQVGG